MPTTCKLIAKNVLGSDTATVTFSNIPDTYTDLMVLASARSSAAASNSQILVRLNGDTGSNYSWRLLTGTGSGVTSTNASSQTRIIIPRVSGATTTANTFGSVEMYVPNYANTAVHKTVSSTGVTEDNDSAAFIGAGAGLWASTNAVTSIALIDQDGSFVSGSSFFLYGITKA